VTISSCIRLAGVITLASIGTATNVFAQTAQADAWKLVPAAPAACFSDDGFEDKVAAAKTAIDADMEKQEKVNAAATERFNNLSGAERAQRMQAFMMKDPQAAMKMLQGEQAAGIALATAVSEADAASQRLEAELPNLHDSFRAAVERAVQPVRARTDALIKAKTVLAGEAQVPMFTTAADHAQYVQLVAEENAAIEQACAPFFGANGSLQKWLASYRTEVTNKLSGGDQPDFMIIQMAAMDLPGGGYRSTAALMHARNYVQQMSVVYAARPIHVQASLGIRR
jgi:hypothetical protein